MSKEKLNELGHLFAGLMLLFHGFDAFELGNFLGAAGYLGLGIIFLIVAGLHKTITKTFYQANALFFLLESISIAYSGWHYGLKHHRFLYYFMTIVGVLFFAFSILSFIYEHKPKRKMRRGRKRRHPHGHLRSHEVQGFQDLPGPDLNDGNFNPPSSRKP